MSRHSMMGIAAAIAMASLGVAAAEARPYTRRGEDEEEARQREARIAERRRLREAAEQRERDALAAEADRPKSRQELRRLDRKKAKRLREDRCFQKGERRP